MCFLIRICVVVCNYNLYVYIVVVCFRSFYGETRR